jgi:CIC family chloride channel protein
MTERTRYSIAVIGVAMATAVFAVAFRGLLTSWYREVFHADNVVEAIASLPWWLRFSVPTCGGAVAGVISSFRLAAPQNVSNVMEAVALGNVSLSLRATLIRVASSWSAIAGGVSIGREGPLIEFGGTFGAAMGRMMRMPLARTRVLIASGTAAGFAAAYNTPFAAVLFVLETIVGVAAPAAMIPAIASTVIATVLARAVVGAGPIYGQRSFSLDSWFDFPSIGALAAVASIAAIGFKWLLASMESWFEIHPIRQPYRATLGGAFVGAIALRLPQVAGNGYEPLNIILDGQMLATAAGLLLVGKVFATSASVASGVPGGVFTPMLLVGASLGAVWSHAVTHVLGTSTPNVGSYALVGMAAATAASTHAPLAAAVLVFELSGDYPIAVPLLLTTFIATSISRFLGSISIYDAELRRRGLGWELTLEGRRIP